MSKELTPIEALNKIGEKWTVCWNNGLGHSNQIKELDEYKTIETALKALEIVKEKILDINYFKVIAANCDLTYQEYNLLMEVLK